MSTVTIPKKITKGQELIVIPRKEYEKFSKWQEFLKSFQIFTPTPAQKKDLKKAREDYQKGKCISIDELKRKLAIRNPR